MFLDSNPLNQPLGTMREVWNMLVNKMFDTRTNEPGFDRTVMNFPSNAKIVGDIKFPDDEVVVFIASDNFSFKNPIQVTRPNTNVTLNIENDELVITAKTGLLNGTVSSDYVAQAVQGFTSGVSNRLSFKGKEGLISGSLSIGLVFLREDLTPISGTQFVITNTALGFPTEGYVDFITPNSENVGYIAIAVSGTVSSGRSSVSLLNFKIENYSEIGKINKDEQYEKILSSNLEYRIDNPIKGVGTYDSYGNKIIAWTPLVGEARILNINNLPFDVDSNKHIVNDEDIALSLLFPESVTPNIEIKTDISGNILTGTYFAAVAYEDREGGRTQFHIPVGPVYVNDEIESASAAAYNGAKPGTATGKGLRINITNIDTRYDKMTVAVIALIGGQYYIKNIVDVEVSNNVTVLFTGNEVGETVPLIEVINNYSIYKNVRDLLILNNELYAANLEAEEEINYQLEANKIVCNYRITTKSINDKTILNGTETTFMPNQVYALYIRWRYKNGKTSRAFHIPGRQLVSTERSPILLSQALLMPDGTPPSSFHVEMTNDYNSQTYTTTGNKRHVTDYTKSNLGYWENKNEVYPSDFPELAGQKVRHHKMPSFNAINNKHYGSLSNLYVDVMPQLTLDVSNIALTDEILKRCIGYEILAARVDPENCTVLAVDQLIYAHNISRQPNNLVWSLGMNARGYFKQAGETSESGGDFRDMLLRTDYIRSHAFDLLKNKPAIAPTHIIPFAKLTRSGLNVFLQNNVNGGAISIAGEDTGRVTAGVIDCTIPSVTSVVKPISFSPLRKVSFYSYVPSNVIYDEGSVRIVSQGCEEALLLELPLNTITNELIPAPLNLNYYSINQEADKFTSTGVEDSFLMTIEQLRTDVFTSFNTQILNSLTNGQLIRIPQGASSTTKLNSYDIKGDCFIGSTSFITGCPRIDDSGNPLVNDGSLTMGVFLIRRHSTIARNNVNFRHIDNEIPGTKYYPKVAADKFIINANREGTTMVIGPWEANVIAYNDDYSKRNDLFQTTIWNTNIIENTKFPNRVIKTTRASRTGYILGALRTFLQDSFYDTNLDRGEINNLAKLDDTLLIHHKYGLFRTIGDISLKADTTEIYLGSRDIFSVDPKEQISAELGYLGNQHKFGTLTFKGGYLFADAAQGKVFLISNSGVVEISNAGFRNYFLKNLKGYQNDNPYIGQGLRFVFDEENDRIIFNKADHFTLSYSLNEEINGWISFHSYYPHFFVNTRSKVFSQLQAGDIFKHNSLTKKCIYYDDIPKESKINLVFNDNAQIDKLFFNINWLTEIYNLTGGLIWNETFDTIQVKNDRQDTGTITLIIYESIYKKGNIRRDNTIWNFNKFRKPAVSPNNARFYGRYIEVILTYNNQVKEGTQNTICVYDVNFNALKAER